METKIGCCGFAKGRKRYFGRFGITEVQQTFYRPPKPEQTSKWREEASEDFEFTIKAWQLITHSPRSPTYRRAGIAIDKEKHDSYGSFRPSEEVFGAWEETSRIARILRATVVVFQCPASFRPSEENIRNMKDFFLTIDRGRLTFAWEPRGPWPRETIADLCEELHLVHCVDPFKDRPLTRGVAYFRLHGSPPGKTMYNYRYMKKDLRVLQDQCTAYDKVYCMFNNLFMWDNALEFIGMMRDQG